MRYQVPQFIDVEDKIFGPLTLKQFLYVAGGAAISFILWNVLPGFLAVIIGGPVFLFFIALAFYKVNRRPLIDLVENMFKYLFSSKLYIWHKQEKPVKKSKAEGEGEAPQIFVPRLSDSKLKELTWGLDINEKLDQYNSAQGIDPRTNDRTK